LPATTPPYHGDTYSPKENPHPPERHLAMGLMIQDARVSPFNRILLLEMNIFYSVLIAHHARLAFALRRLKEDSFDAVVRRAESG